MQFDAFMYWAETSLTPRLWAVCDDARDLAQRSEDLVRQSHALLRHHRDEKLRQAAFEERYVLRLSERPNDKLLAAVHHHRERAINLLPSAYHRACRTWFYSLSLVDRMTADLASRIYLDGNATTAERIAARLPSAPGLSLRPADEAAAPASRLGHRLGYRRRGGRANG